MWIFEKGVSDWWNSRCMAPRKLVGLHWSKLEGECGDMRSERWLGQSGSFFNPWDWFCVFSLSVMKVVENLRQKKSGIWHKQIIWLPCGISKSGGNSGSSQMSWEHAEDTGAYLCTLWWPVSTTPDPGSPVVQPLPCPICQDLLLNQCLHNPFLSSHNIWHISSQSVTLLLPL